MSLGSLIILLLIPTASANCIRAFTNEEYVNILIKSDQLKHELGTIIKNIDKTSFDKSVMEKRFETALKHRRFIADQISRNLLKMDVQSSRFRHMKDIRDEIDKENLVFTNWRINGNR